MSNAKESKTYAPPCILYLGHHMTISGLLPKTIATCGIRLTVISTFSSCIGVIITASIIQTNVACLFQSIPGAKSRTR